MYGLVGNSTMLHIHPELLNELDSRNVQDMHLLGLNSGKIMSRVPAVGKNQRVLAERHRRCDRVMHATRYLSEEGIPLFMVTHEVLSVS